MEAEKLHNPNSENSENEPDILSGLEQASMSSLRDKLADINYLVQAGELDTELADKQVAEIEKHIYRLEDEVGENETGEIPESFKPDLKLVSSNENIESDEKIPDDQLDLSDIDQSLIQELETTDSDLQTEVEKQINSEYETIQEKIDEATRTNQDVIETAAQNPGEYIRVFNEVRNQLANEVWLGFVKKHLDNQPNNISILTKLAEDSAGLKDALLEVRTELADEFTVKEDGPVEVSDKITDNNLNKTVYAESTGRPAMVYPPTRKNNVNLLNHKHRVPVRVNTPETGLASKPDVSEVEREYEKILGISYEELQTIEGFEKLSGGQKKMVLENLSQCTLGNVQEEAERLYKESADAEQNRYRNNILSFLGGDRTSKRVAVISNALAGAASKFNDTFKKESRLARKQIDALDKIKNKGVENNLEILVQLVDSMLENGPEVFEKPSGELVVDLINLQSKAEYSDMEEAELLAMLEINNAADEFARIPIEWRGETLGVDATKKGGLGSFINSSDNHKKAELYQVAKANFEKARGDLEQKLRNDGKSDAEITKTLIAVDNRVNQLQILRTNPDAIDVLNTIEEQDPDKIATQSLMKNGRVGYIALGSITRSVLGQSLGLITAPAVAFATGSIRSWNRSAAELRERDRNARRGVKDDSIDALNVVDADSLQQKLEREILLAQNATGAEKSKQLAKLKSRIEYTHDKQMLNRVNYGAQKNMVSTMTQLSKTVGEGLSYLSMEEGLESEVTKERTKKTAGKLESKLKRTETSIDETRSKKRKYAAVKDGAKASLASLGGVLVTDTIITEVNELAAGGMTPIVDGVKETYNDLAETVESGIESVTDGGTGIEMMPDNIEAEPLTEDIDTSVNEKELEDIPSNLPTAGEDDIPLNFDEYLEATDTASGESVPVQAVEAAEVLGHGTYTIRDGDTMTEILRGAAPSISSLDEAIQENAIANILEDMSPEDMQKIGFIGDDVDLIQAGNEIDLDALQEVVESKKHFIDQAIERFSS